VEDSSGNLIYHLVTQGAVTQGTVTYPGEHVPMPLQNIPYHRRLDPPFGLDAEVND